MGSDAYRRKRRRPKLAVPILALLLAVIVALLSVFEVSSRRLIRDEARIRVREAAERALAEAVALALCGDVSFDLLTVTETGGESFIINADTLLLNRLVNAVTRGAQEELKRMGSLGVGIQTGTVSGMSLLTGRGPELSVSFSPLGAVSARPLSSLTSAGINQCLFRLSLELTAEVLVPMLGSGESLTVKSTIPIAETVIVGRVPQVYTNVANEEDMLNLIPTEPVE